jgi:hypothetical protein
MKDDWDGDETKRRARLARDHEDLRWCFGFFVGGVIVVVLVIWKLVDLWRVYES